MSGADPPTTGGQDNPPFGTFQYQSETERLEFSDGMFSIFGFAPGQVVPTLALMASHQHPEDLPGWNRAIAQVLSDGEPVSRWHRIVDAHTRVRTVHTSIQATRVSARVVEIRGVTADLTERLRQDRAQEVERAVTRSAQTRAVIDQAKGILMATLDLNEDQAFDLLRWHSNFTNIKLRDLAATLIQRLAEADPAGTPPRQRLTTILTGLTGARQPVLPAGELLSHRPPPADRAGALPRRIPVALLPRTLVRAVSAAALSITIADVLAPDQPLVYVNAAFETLTGYPANEILGRNCRFLQGPDTDPAHTAAIRTALTRGEEVRTVLRNYRRDGTAFWNELHLSAVHDADGRLTHYIGYQSDVSERIAREQQLEHLAYHDAATSLPNHAAALKHLDTAIAAATADTAFTVVHISLTGFRPTDTSDDPDLVRAVLTTAAQRLNAVLSAPAFLAKLDDDSFLGIVPDPPQDPEGTATTAAFRDPIHTSVGPLQLTISLGHTRYPHDATNPHALIAAARAAAHPHKTH